MNENARKVIDIMANHGNPMSSENIDVTRAAFPLAVAEFFQVSVDGDQTTLMAVCKHDLHDDRILIQWSSEIHGDGYSFSQPPIITPVKKTTFWREARRRLVNAWRALCDADNEDDQ